MSIASLTELANRYGSDKGTIGPGPGCDAHNYTDVYEAYLQRLRPLPINVLEIGLGVVGEKWDARIVQGRNTGGASLKMWYDYFPRARIYGIDINSCPYLDNDRIRTFVADQSNVADLESFLRAINQTAFDVIIDDGSHRPDHQQVSLDFFFKRLNPGGLYFIEDLGRNGLGDGASGRSASDKVINTRAVLRHFARDGRFLEPNAFTDPGYLAANIASVSFHAPKTVVGFRLCASLRRPVRKSIAYRSESELLCAILKK